MDLQLIAVALSPEVLDSGEPQVAVVVLPAFAGTLVLVELHAALLASPGVNGILVLVACRVTRDIALVLCRRFHKPRSLQDDDVALAAGVKALRVSELRQVERAWKRRHTCT